VRICQIDRGEARRDSTGSSSEGWARLCVARPFGLQHLLLLCVGLGVLLLAACNSTTSAQRPPELTPEANATGVLLPDPWPRVIEVLRRDRSVVRPVGGPPIEGYTWIEVPHRGRRIVGTDRILLFRRSGDESAEYRLTESLRNVRSRESRIYSFVTLDAAQQ